MRSRALALLLLSFLGLVDTLYLGMKRGKPVVCSITSGCDEVLNSKYSAVGGVPISWLGFLFYLTVFSSSAFALFGEERVLRWIFWIALPAFLVSLGLFGVQAFVLHAYCQYCLGSALLVTLIFLICPKSRQRLTGMEQQP